MTLLLCSKVQAMDRMQKNDKRTIQPLEENGPGDRRGGWKLENKPHDKSYRPKTRHGHDTTVKQTTESGPVAQVDSTMCDGSGGHASIQWRSSRDL